MPDVSIDIGNKNVLIIGWPASGKSYVGERLAADNPTHTLVHTDKYIKWGYEQSLYMLLEDLAKIKGPTIIEGALGYRLLRKGVEREIYYPDIVIELEISEERMLKTYKDDRPDKDVTYVKAANKGNQTVLNKYRELDNPHPPIWITQKNDYK